MKNTTAQIVWIFMLIFCLYFWRIPANAVDGILEQVGGISSETTAMLLLLPVIATLISVLHYIVGVSGYGIFMPTMIAVVFMSTGIGEGLILFATILGISILSNMVLKKMKLHFWPARSMGLMMISMIVFGLMFFLKNISISSVLFMILLAEEFVRTQLSKSKKEAIMLTVGTLVLAIFGAIVLKSTEVQRLVLDNPMVTILIVVVVNIMVGNYKGIRLTEIKRFKNAIRKK